MRTLVAVLLIVCTGAVAQQRVCVKNQLTHRPIGDVLVICGGVQAETDSSGRAWLPVPPGEHLIEAFRLGYFPLKDTFTLKEGDNTLYMLEKNLQLKDVVVTAEKPLIKSTVVANIMDSDELRKKTTAELGNLLSDIGGVSTIKTGGTIVKPVIQGMHSQRIIVLNNGVAQQGQSWGLEHAPEIDPYIAHELSVIKGAEGVRYGSGALGGVVSVSPKGLAYGSSKIQGHVSTALKSNGQGATLSSSVEGGLPRSKMAWRVQSTQHVSADSRTPHYALNNTGVRSLGFSTTVGYRADGFRAEAYYSYYRSILGVFFGSHIANREDLLQRFRIGYPLRTFKAGYAIEAPKQDVHHHLTKISAFWKPFGKGELGLQYSLQMNRRKEFSVRRLDRTQIPSLDLQLSTHSIEPSYTLQWKGRWNSEVGASYKHQSNQSVPGTGAVPIIPNYVSMNTGIYALQAYGTDRYHLELGIRFGRMSMDVAGVTRYSNFYFGQREFKNRVFSASGTYVNGRFTITSNAGMAWRSPHVSELYSNGLHHGTSIYEYGDDTLLPEKGLKWINSATYAHRNLEIQLTAFLQKIKNYIYERPTKNTISLFSGEYPIFEFRQNDAFFRGAELNVKYQPYKNVAYDFLASATYATNLDNDGYFPFIPPESFQQKITYTISSEQAFLSKLYAAVQHRFVSKQIRFDESTELVASSPGSYHLFGVTAGRDDIVLKNKRLSIHMSVHNLFNKVYKDYTNRFRYYAHELGRNVQIKTLIDF